MRILGIPQKSDAWHAWRRGKLGGSDMGAIMLGDDWPYEDSRVEQLLKLKVEGGRTETNFAMRRGERMEPLARASWEVEHSVAAPPVCVEHEECEWMGVSLDGLATLRDGRRVILEIKAPKWQEHNLALCGMVPAHYVPQCQYQLLVTGLDLLHFISITEHQMFGASKADPKIAIVEMTPDPEYQAEILERGQKFWDKVLFDRRGWSYRSPLRQGG